MKSIFKTIVSVSVWLLFIKGLLLIPVTIYTFILSFLNGDPTPLVGVMACAAGTFALVSACFAVWIRNVVD